MSEHELMTPQQKLGSSGMNVGEHADLIRD